MKCRNDVLMEKIGINKLDKNVEVTLEALSNLPDCRQINAKSYVSIAVEGETTPAPTFNRFKMPKNQFECMRTGCQNSGTLYPGSGAGTVVYRVTGDATAYAAGVITFYVTTNDAVEVMISDASDFTNADKYTITPASAASDGFYAIVVDLSQTATAVGTGWSATGNGAYISIKIAAGAGLSSIAVFDSIEDFETSRVVKIGCLTELSSDIAIAAAEATCWSHGYDTSSDVSIERTITGNKITPNYWWLNPLHGKGTATKAFILTTQERTVVADSGYGTVVLSDIDPDECGFLSVSTGVNCNITTSQLQKLSVPMKVALDEGHYFVLPNEDGSSTIYFNSALVGETVIVSYPKSVEVEEEVGDAANIGEVRVRYTESYVTTDGTQYVMVFNNVLVTSFPYTINEDETTFSFTITIQPDTDGHLYHRYRVLN